MYNFVLGSLKLLGCYTSYYNGVLYVVSCYNFLKITRVVVSYLYLYSYLCWCPCILPSINEPF